MTCSDCKFFQPARQVTPRTVVPPSCKLMVLCQAAGAVNRAANDAACKGFAAISVEVAA